jgi:hypothetical protein
MDGSPRVVPIWLHWTGGQFFLASLAKAPKLRALAADRRVALTIDDDEWPYKVLLVRGRANVEMLDDVSPEYELAATRCFGPERGSARVSTLRGTPTAPHRHHTWLGGDIGLPDPVPECPDALEP